MFYNIWWVFQKQLQPDEKQEMLEIIDDYHKGYIPLIVPTTS